VLGGLRAGCRHGTCGAALGTVTRRQASRPAHPGHPPFSLLFLQLALGSLFQGLELSSLQPTSLTLMYPLGTASNSTNIRLDPMEIATFRIRLG